MKLAHRKWWKLFGLALWLALGLGLLKIFNIRWSEWTIERVRETILSFGWKAPLIYLAVFAQPLIPLPGSILAMAAGVAFGAIQGTALAVVAATVRGCGQFLIARALGREAIQSLLKGKLAMIDARIGRNGFQTVFWIRVLPNLPFDIQNLALGVSRVSFRAFALATFVGLVPMLFLWVYLGKSLSNMSQVWGILAALVVFVVFWTLQKYLRQKKAAQS